MNNVATLNGCSVRDSDGRAGRVLSVTEGKIKLAWLNKGVIAEEVEFERGAIPASLQVLTLSAGWQALAATAGLAESRQPTRLRELAEDLDGLFEAKKRKKANFGKKKHSPFKNFSRLGPGPGQSTGTREVSRKIQWDCTKTGKYKQRCVMLKQIAPGRYKRTNKVKKITIDPAYRAAYNQDYKPWHSKNHR